MSRTRWLVTVVASVSALVGASPASADFSATQVTEPANLSHPLNNKDAPPSDTLHIAGTATGSGTTVTLDCVTPQGGATALELGVDASSGSFSADIPASSLPSSPCVIRALPTGTNPDPSMAPGQTSVWDGPIILPGYRQTSYTGGNSATPAYDFMAGNVKSGGSWLYASGGDCPIYDGGVLDPTTFDISDDSLYCNAAFFDVNNAGHSPTRSQLVIDNRNAYLPADAQRVNHGATHFPALVTPVFTYDSSNGDLTLHYVEKIVRCDVTGADPYPATPGNCADFADTGVQLDTWITQNSDASTTSLTQRFSATDGGDHTIDALSDQEFLHTHSSGGVIFPWLGSSYQGYAAGTPIAPPPPGAGSMYGKNDLASPEDTLAGVQGAITWAAAPESIRVTQGTSDPNSDFELGYRKSISASAPMWLGWSFAVGETQSGIAAAAHNAEAGFTPHIAITAPGDGFSTSATTAHVTGTASDNSGDPVVVSVNGHSASVDTGGNWSVDVPLSPGANILTATVTNRYGTSASASRSVTRPVASHIFHGARFHGSHTLRLDRHGNLVLRIACPADSATACSGTASIASASAVRAAAKRPRAKVLKVGSKKFKVAAGKTEKVTIRVTAKARRYIKKHHKLRAKLTITSRDAATAVGKNKKITAKLTIKPAAAKKRKG